MRVLAPGRTSKLPRQTVRTRPQVIYADLLLALGMFMTCEEMNDGFSSRTRTLKHESINYLTLCMKTHKVEVPAMRIMEKNMEATI